MSQQSSGEFALIRQYFSSGFPRNTNTRLGVGDDCSVITLPHGFQLAQSIDTQVADVHFPAAAPADLIAQRALRCAVSDLAAMGAEPQGFHLALTLPDADPQWLQLFSEVWAISFRSERRWDVYLKNGMEIRLPEKDPISAWSLLAAIDREKTITNRSFCKPVHGPTHGH